MSGPAVNSPFVLAKTFVFRRYLTVRHRLVHLHLSARSLHEAHQRRRQERHDARMLNFYGWCEACRGLGSIF